MVNDESANAADFAIVDGCVRLRLDLRCYRLTAIQKAAYRLADRCTVILGDANEERLDVRIAFKPTIAQEEGREAVRMFFQELLDQELRERVGQETAPLRALLMAQAFSNTDLINRE